MSVLSPKLIRASALALLLSTTSLAGAAFAADPPSSMDNSGAPNSTMSVDQHGNMATTPDTNVPGGNQPMVNDPNSGNRMGHGMHQGMMGDHKSPPSPEMMKMHVEERIKALHAKLSITPDQEKDFGAVAQAMRDNEQQMASLIQDHEGNRGKLSAVDSLNSYTKIAQAHVDGLKNVSSAFSTLYNEMSPEQKMKADKVFSEGPEGMHHMKHMHHMNNQQPAK